VITRLEAPPEPPADLGSRTPLEIVVEVGESLHRFYSRAYLPVHFDRSFEGRLNAHDGSYGVLYVAAGREGAFAETFLRSPGRTLLPIDLVRAKASIVLKTTRALRLARLAGPGLGRIGATAQVVHGGKPYVTSQAWSGALYAHPGGFDGIAYYARHDDEALCYAIFDRARDALVEEDRLLELDEDWFWDLAEIYGVGLAPD